jgi:hypothetical protein
MATPMVIAGLVELAKLGLQAYFLAMQTAGRTQEEIDMIYQQQKEYFLTHGPDTLPDVGEDEPPEGDV